MRICPRATSHSRWLSKLTRSSVMGLTLAGAAHSAEAQQQQQEMGEPEILAPDAGLPRSQASVESEPKKSMSDPVTVSYNLTVATDSASRGVSQTGGKPVVQGSAEIASGYLYAGVWASNVDYDDGTKAEVDFYTGVRGQTRSIDWDLRVLGYVYPGQPDAAESNYIEFRASAAKRFGPATFGAVAFYSPDHFGPTDEESYFFQLTGAYEINPRWSVSGGVGHKWVPGPQDHATWHFGPTFKATDKVSIDLRYVDTDSHEFGSNYDERVILAVKTSF